MDGVRATLLGGQAFGLQAPTTVHTPLVSVDLQAVPDTAGAHAARLPLASAFEHAILCVSGTATIEEEPVAPGEMLYLGTGRDHIRLQISQGARLLLIGGEPFDKPVLMWWNFVARTADEIVQASHDWNHTDRFGTVRGTSLSRIPAPDPSGVRHAAGKVLNLVSRDTPVATGAFPSMIG